MASAAPSRLEPRGTGPLSPVLIAVLAAAALPLFFARLGSGALLDPDEPYYAVPALEMLRAGIWSVPVFHGQPWFDKPILFYWIVLGAFKAFGISEWSARIGSALAGASGAAAMAMLAPRGWRRGDTHVLAAVVLATSVEYALLSRAAVTDMTLTLFLTLGALAFARHLESRSAPSAIAAGAAWGLAALTKGPVGVLVPACALAGWRLSARGKPLLAPRAWLAVLGGFAATGAPWYAFMLVAHRDLLVRVFLGQENLGRFVRPEHVQFPFFYVVVFGIGLLPWSAALPAALLRAARDVAGGQATGGPTSARAFGLVWFLAVVGPFSLSASKLLTYVLPAFPAAALLIAAYWREALDERPLGAPLARGPRLVAWAGAATSLGSALGLAALARSGRFTGAGRPLLGLAAIVAASGLVSAAVVARRRLGAFALVQASTTLATVLVLVTFVVPRVEASESTRGLVAALERRGLSGEIYGTYRVPDVSLDFYLNRPLFRETDPARLARDVAVERGRLWVVRTAEIGALAANGGLELERVASSPRRSVVRLSPASVTSVPGGGP